MFQISQKILMKHQRMKLTKIFFGILKLAWTRFNKSAMWFQSFTDVENITCYQFSNINILYINNAVCSAFFGHLILHFALLPRIYSFGQNMKYWCSLRGVLVFTSWGFFFVFLGGYFWCMYVYVCVWVCVYTVESKLENSSIYPLPSSSRNKTNLYICYFFFSNNAQN